MSRWGSSRSPIREGDGRRKDGGMLGAFLGSYAALAVFFGVLVGALVSGALMAEGKMQRGSALPFGVFLSLTGVVTLFVGQDIWNFYLRMIGGGKVCSGDLSRLW